MREKIIRFIAGLFVLLGLTLGIWVNTQWYWLVAFVGFNLFQSSITSFCPLELILKKVGIKE